MRSASWIKRSATAYLAVALFRAAAGAEPPSAVAPAADDVLALLETHCVKCHGGEKIKGGLDLVTRAGLLRGGESGAAITADDPHASLMLQMLRHEVDPHMPHKKEKLPDAAIAQIEGWIKLGAPYSRPLKKVPAGSSPAGFTITDDDREHWAFQPIQRRVPPPVRANERVANPIDQFILAKLEARGLSLSAPARPEALIRRITFDLIGLPPTPEEVDGFIAAAGSDPESALSKLIDRLLASPHYGERWGRHWLDLARYAETDGFEHDAVRPHSWRYRDYVISAFNTDKPYERFIREQLAGDELWPAEPEALIATGFNLLGPDMVDSSDQVQRRHNTLNDMTDTVALTFLGLTMGCARCHDHKFEPISQRDYYSLQACFAPAVFRREEPIPTSAERAANESATRSYHEHPTVRALTELEAPIRETLRQKKLAKLSPEAQSAHQTPPDQRNAEQANLVLETEEMVKVSDDELGAAFKGAGAAQRKALIEAARRLPKPEPLPRAMGLGTGKRDAKSFVLYRGDYNQPGAEARPAVPQVLQARSARGLAGKGHRTMLANWVASPENPLIARVMVNRIWQHHFGRGIVGTPSDFGTHGQKPTHPELLDWLASEFIQGGWSVKKMHKLILMSATYRQATAAADEKVHAAARSADPENRWYWRMNRLRLEGEAIRDSLLAISGRLNPKIGGPGVFPPIPGAVFQGAKGWSVSKDPRDHARRSVYIFARRNLRFPFLEVFDAPDNNLSCPSRERSTTAPQSLTLLNAEEVSAAAAATAERLMNEAGSTDERITRAMRLTLGRAPKPAELVMAREFLVRSPLREFCRVLFNLNDFVYVE